MTDHPHTHLQRRLLEAQDHKLRRCWYCGTWAYHLDDCTTCAAPASKAALLNDQEARGA
jgi:hypothetical protein